MLYIHTGFTKTGSTSLQNFIFRNAALFKQHGLVYPKCGLVGSAHHQLAHCLQGKDGYEVYGEIWHDLANEIRKAPELSYAVSAEGLSVVHGEAFARVREILDGIDVRVIVYVRKFSKYWPSQYTQRVKMGIVFWSFDEFYKSRGRLFGDDAKYNAEGLMSRIEGWGDAFGWDAIRVRSLDRSVLVDGDLYADFVNAIGLNIGDLEDSLAPESREIKNTSPGWKAVELIKEIHGAYRGPVPEGQRRHRSRDAASSEVVRQIQRKGVIVAEELGLNDEQGQYLTQKQWEWANEVYDAEVARVNEKLVGFQLPKADRQQFTPRKFLPDSTFVPRMERLSFIERMLEELPPDACEAITSNLADFSAAS